MNDRIVVRMVVGGLIAIILLGLGLASLGTSGGDVFSDAVKIGLGALAGILARTGPGEVTLNQPDDKPVPVNEVGDADNMP